NAACQFATFEPEIARGGLRDTARDRDSVGDIMSAKRSDSSRASLVRGEHKGWDDRWEHGSYESERESADWNPRDRQLSKHVASCQQPPQQQVSPLPTYGWEAPSWSDSVDRSGMAEMCQYVQRLEAEKRDLQDQTNLLREQDARQRLQLSAAAARIEMLQSSLQHSMAASEAHREEKDSALHQQVLERDRIGSLVALLEEAQTKYAETERARQHAIYMLSALQASAAEVSAQRILTPLGGGGDDTFASSQGPGRRGSRNGVSVSRQGSQDDMSLALGERIEKYRREMELLRQTLELKDEQAAEKQRVAVEAALRSAFLDHRSALENLKLEYELRLSEWRHEEALRSKETEAAMDEDRYSIRLETRHALQRAQIEQRVSYLQAQAALSTSSGYANHHHHGESDFSFGTLDEVLVRMQLEQLRMRRFDALRRVILIRQSKLEQMSKDLFCRWRIQTTNIRILKLNAVLHMHRIVSHLGLRKKRSYFNDWKGQARLLSVHSYQNHALRCWNRMLAAERICHVLHQRVVKREAVLFSRWRLASVRMAASSTPSPASTGDSMSARGGTSGDGVSDTLQAAASGTETSGTADVQSLQDEIKKLHEQLAASKGEAWRYKRQLLKQFL
ncbi:hypothetical protein PybrP1_004665, partial [[Pythium] brassicae (nom. inval.)]